MCVWERARERERERERIKQKRARVRQVGKQAEGGTNMQSGERQGEWCVSIFLPPSVQLLSTFSVHLSIFPSTRPFIPSPAMSVHDWSREGCWSSVWTGESGRCREKWLSVTRDKARKKRWGGGEADRGVDSQEPGGQKQTAMQRHYENTGKP